ncbi:adenosylcobinamide-GDP ribazoletransferase [Leptospira sp. 'Mane']|uniref:adenosylcobinamide-GDP ribazoletransferase n=1 Tax=Leptospira sp. 'Mane' TaxID=3387407 RepID=UPI00398B0144
MKSISKYLIHELRLFFIAIWFLSRLPIPKWVGFQEEWLDTSIKYSSFVGIVLGSIGFIAFFLFQVFFGTLIAFILSTGLLIILTGCFHEDGFSDFCDGIGGGWKREDILRIMKDSRVGSFGAAGLSLLLLLKVAAGYKSLEILDGIFHYQILFTSFETAQSLFTEDWIFILQTWLLFITAHSFSRFISLSFLLTDEYAKDEGYAKPMAKSLTWGQFLFSGIAGLGPLFVLSYFSPLFLFIFIPCFLIRKYFSNLMRKWIGGFTGDCLGAVQQGTETLVWIWGAFLWISF